jgi:hypothetical protein
MTKLTEAETLEEQELVLADLEQYLRERVVPRLPVDCEWRWVAFQFQRALARHYGP